MRPRLFVDMDGTLAVWNNVYLEQLYEPGYFRNLPPLDQMIQKVTAFARQGEAEVFILSAYLPDSPYALKEKQEWLEQYLPEVDAAHRLFIPCGANKGHSVPGGIYSTDFLLDDYTKNLQEWTAAGGTGIKLLNGINSTQNTWLKSGGLYISYEEPLHVTMENLTHMIENTPSDMVSEQRPEEMELD